MVVNTLKEQKEKFKLSHVFAKRGKVPFCFGNYREHYEWFAPTFLTI